MATTLKPPAADPPMLEDGQHAPSWAAFFDDVARGLVQLQTAAENPTPVTGVTNGSDAAAGTVGECIEAINGVPVAAGAGVTVNAATMTLSAGDWEVSGEAYMAITAGTATALTAGIGTTSGVVPALGSQMAAVQQGWTHSATLHVLALAACRMNLTATTVVYLTARPTGTGANCYGRIMARRMR